MSSLQIAKEALPAAILIVGASPRLSFRPSNYQTETTIEAWCVDAFRAFFYSAARLGSSLPVVSKMQQEQKKEAVAAHELPPCCGTGCAVCVLDYPELFASCADQVDPGTLAMLEAIEQAQAGHITGESGGGF
ncbi:MAG TPA: hypothetical protein PLD20_22620 [Blastocatellia bacterium]|nr:hypothetical protein [Blastocatellia bacterium]HMX27431.1 hypothetical protein [Blastocatellia bacterium]HMY74778.1 hypothetical protein [Blastocatellia bacterium]HMZ20746.1 hypothetical protein [Blastocatellia bacterium]HNG30563.1 hypothetical protein [Blastocatellia bacterium]